nr:MAG TPA: hypothetical protein [Caudoviricetes sp.]
MSYPHILQLLVRFCFSVPNESLICNLPLLLIQLQTHIFVHNFKFF